MMSWKDRLHIRSSDENDNIRRGFGHDFPCAGTLDQLSYCQKCGCGASFAPTSTNPDFQQCPGKRPT